MLEYVWLDAVVSHVWPFGVKRGTTEVPGRAPGEGGVERAYLLPERRQGIWRQMTR
jgi:hypothetical protein